MTPLEKFADIRLKLGDEAAVRAVWEELSNGKMLIAIHAGNRLIYQCYADDWVAVSLFTATRLRDIQHKEEEVQRIEAQVRSGWDKEVYKRILAGLEAQHAELIRNLKPEFLT